MLKLTLLYITLLAALLSPTILLAGQPSKKNLVYAEVKGQKLALDLYLPKKSEHPPLVVWIHGGAWRSGNKKDCKLSWLTKHGFAVASISYRLTDVAPFPAQIHDCKAAVRWLRAHADTFGYSTQNIAVAGSSAGGMLAALLGTSNGVKELEGNVGKNLAQSSQVDAIVDYYGPTDFVMRITTQPHITLKPGGAVYQLFGGPADKKLKLTKLASAVTHVSADDPPLLMFHGAKDPLVKPVQSERLRTVYQEKKLPVELIMIPGVGHGGKAFFTKERKNKVVSFLEKNLKVDKKP